MYKMKVLKAFNIPHYGLKEGLHQFEYTIDKAFFDSFNWDEFDKCDLKVELDFVKKATLLELHFKLTGWVEVPCDVSNELFQMPLDGSLKLIVKFGDAYDDSDDEVLVIPHAEHHINVSQYIYELSVLSMPLKRVNPLSDQLEEEIEREDKEVKKDKIDPRWDKLKDLLK